MKSINSIQSNKNNFPSKYEIFNIQSNKNNFPSKYEIFKSKNVKMLAGLVILSFTLIIGFAIGYSVMCNNTPGATLHYYGKNGPNYKKWED